MGDLTLRFENAAMNSPQPNRFLDVTRADGVSRELRVIEGQLLVCQGCCCGQTEHGFPAVPLDEFKRQWKERGFRLRVHLTVTGCLGPCPLANVVTILFGGETVWLHSINAPEQVTEIFDYLERLLDAGTFEPPTGPLAALHFNRLVFDAASPGEWRSEKRPVAKA